MPEPDNVFTKEQMITLGYLCAAVGHTVINAMSVVVSNAELLRHSLDSSRIDPSAPREDASLDRDDGPEDLIDGIVKAALDASHLTRRLIDHVNPKVPEKADLVDLGAILKEIVAADRTHMTDLEVPEETRSPGPWIRGDRTQIRLLLDLLSQSARQAVADSRVIMHLSTAEDEQTALIEIDHQGVAIDPANLSPTLEPFRRNELDPAGIALSVARAIVRSHGGSIRFSNIPNQGLTIQVRFPSATTTPVPGPT